MPHGEERQCRIVVSVNAAAILIYMSCSIFGSVNSLRSSCLLGCVSGSSMTSSNTFAYNSADQAILETAHDYEEFINANEKELFYVDEADDNDEDRSIYGWGRTCPVELVDGVEVCKSFKAKHNKCESVVCEAMARNYLAQHLFNSTNHPMHGDKSNCFLRANTEEIRHTTETMEDRRNHREYYIYYRDQAQRVERQDNRRDQGARDRERTRGRDRAIGSASSSSSFAKAGGGGKAESSGVPICAPPPAPPPAPPMLPPPMPPPVIGASMPHAPPPSPQEASSRTTNATAIVKVETRRVRVSLEEMQSLEACLARAIAAQKRTVDGLDFFSRMIHDERKVFTEAKKVIAEMIFNARMAKG